MHARPKKTGPRITLTCLIFMPVAALSAEVEGLGAPDVNEPEGAPAADVGPVGMMRVAVAVLEPMKPPDGEDVGVLLEAEFDELGFLLTSWKLAQAMRVLLA